MSADVDGCLYTITIQQPKQLELDSTPSLRFYSSYKRMLLKNAKMVSVKPSVDFYPKLKAELAGVNMYLAYFNTIKIMQSS